ncbi:Lrp/AsnC family transcriptional regulator [Amorphus orientalis]|uniref:DNA-binding Lrp family transcriptional regulator n=1 Tax=Amorphus orientalis TaxID=649198 RepID=A0AAE4AQI1_9HYPH|nr:Lrp/AsnC family transcriptional regulator [Amorphus orientalis]MDQ0314111.1 DNA-binding Lrp family transcriptional regulator [Amorphus orientalis]
MTLRLDGVDWKILKELQSDGRITNVELARRVGITAPPCLRRVRALEESGAIRAYRALLDEQKLGFDISAFAMISLARQSEADLRAFEESVSRWEIVRHAWIMAGDIDFMLECVAETVTVFHDFVLKELVAADNVDTVRTALTIRKVKDAPRVPIPGS